MSSHFSRPSTVAEGISPQRSRLLPNGRKGSETNEQQPQNARPTFSFNLDGLGCNDETFLADVKLATANFQSSMLDAMMNWQVSVVKAAGRRIAAKQGEIEDLNATLNNALDAVRTYQSIGSDALAHSMETRQTKPEFLAAEAPLPTITEQEPIPMPTSGNAGYAGRADAVAFNQPRPHTTDGVNLRKGEVEAPPRSPKDKLKSATGKIYGWTRTVRFSAGKALIEMTARGRGFEDNEYGTYIFCYVFM